MAGGLLQHYLAIRKKGTRVVAFTHIWLGRSVITLGMINGGLGLKLSGNGTRGDYIAYGVVAGVIWLSYLVWVVVGDLVRPKKEVKEKDMLGDRLTETSS